ncbi:caspase family protein [Sphaerisporangium sp. NPDC051017]|uniref:caspase, EACC1-associated type n=1 Tax=Sphaerisporangium sp. NPDC051017 TaxID=3154636 RepID=UPI0034409CA1
MSLASPVLPDPGGSRAVLIGVSTYRLLPGLPGVDHNLADLRRVLADRELWGLPDEHCAVLDTDALAGVDAYARVADTLRAAGSAATEGLVVYYAGHGLLDPDDGDELHLSLPGTDRHNFDHGTVPFTLIRRALKRSRARYKVVVLDCCYSGQAHGRTLSGDAVVVIEGACVLTATAATRKAWSDPGERGTAFTRRLVNLLGTGIEDGPRLLDMSTVFREMDERLRGEALPRPQLTVRDGGGYIALARNRGYREAVPVSPEPPVASPGVPARWPAGVALAIVSVIMVGIIIVVGLAQRPTQHASFDPGTNWVRSIAYSPGGASFAAGSDDGLVRVVDPKTNSGLAVLPGHLGPVRAVAYSPDGKSLATGSDDRTVKIWNIATGTATVTLRRHTGAVESVAYSPDGRRLASAGDDGVVLLWDLTARVPTAVALTAGTGPVYAVAFGPGGKHLASGGKDGKVRVWDTRDTARAPDVLTGHTAPVRSLSYRSAFETFLGAASEFLASASDDKTVRVWNIDDRSTFYTLTEHTGPVRVVTYSPDGMSLATASDDRTVRLWAVGERQGGVLVTASAAVPSVAFSADGKFVLVGGSGAKVTPYERKLFGVPLPPVPVGLG